MFQQYAHSQLQIRGVESYTGLNLLRQRQEVDHLCCVTQRRVWEQRSPFDVTADPTTGEDSLVKISPQAANQHVYSEDTNKQTANYLFFIVSMLLMVTKLHFVVLLSLTCNNCIYNYTDVWLEASSLVRVEPQGRDADVTRWAWFLIKIITKFFLGSGPNPTRLRHKLWARMILINSLHLTH